MKTFFIAGCASALLLFSGAAMQACRAAAEVFVSSVMPALFPMMVLSRLLPAPKGRGRLAQTALFGWLSGSPAAAQRVRDSGAQGRALDELLCLTGVMSPLFFTGTLSTWLGSRAMGWKMLLAHWLGAVITALVWRGESAQAEGMQSAKPPSLVSAVGQSASALLSVCGAMMLFSAVAGVLQEVCHLPGPVCAVLQALLEIGSGAKAVVCAFGPSCGALLCALCSFGGLSLWLQNLLFLDENIRPAKLLCMRALHGAVSYGLFSLLSFL